MHKTLDQLYTDLIGFINLAIPENVVIRGNEGGPQPNGEYASILLIGTDQRGLDSTEYIPQDPPTELAADEKVSGITEAQFSVQFFRGDAHERARKLARFSQTAVGSEYLYNVQVASMMTSDVVSTRYKVAEEWIERASLTLTVHASSELITAVNTIGEVTITVNADETITVTE